ncbi:MAG: diacylglycerol kinase, partial [Bacillota bacterium]
MKYDGLSESFNYAIEGLVHALRTQRNMKIHFLAAFFVLLASLVFDIT